MQLLGMLQKLHPPGALTFAPAVHCFSCAGFSTIRRQSEKNCSEPTFTYTLGRDQNLVKHVTHTHTHPTDVQTSVYPSK